MPTRRYTVEQLVQLRNSPLVKKPENLPPIEQWIDEASQNKQGHVEQAGRTNARQAGATSGGAASPMGNFSTGQRPSLLHTRTTGSRSDDVSLGPPKSGFASNRSISRLASFQDDHVNGEDAETSRFRTFVDRQHQRKNTEKDLRGERESWTATRDRRAFAESEHARSDSNVDRDSKLPRRDNHDPTRRNGDRSDTRWGQKDDTRPNGERQGGWRERENNRRPWDRSEAVERDPEWFDEPVAAKQQQTNDDLNSSAPPRTQEEFEKWKAKMHGKDLPQETTVPSKEPPKPREALKLDGVVEVPLPGFGLRSPEPTGEQGVSKQPAGKAKASRFASMFKKEDVPIEAPSVPEPPATAPPALPLTNTADKEGFQRILQMLGANESPAVPEPRSPTKTTANGARQRSRFFDAVPKSPEEARPGLSTTEAATVPQELASRPKQAPSTSPLPPNITPSHQRTSTVDAQQDDLSRQGMPKGGTSTPENHVLNLIAGNRASRQSSANNKDAAFLLGLLQGHSSRPPSQTARPEADFPLWVSPPPEQHAPKPRAPPPPGHIDDHLLRGPVAGPGAEGDAARRQAQRPPPGFDEQALFMQQQQHHQFQHRQGQPPFDPSQVRRGDVMPPGMPQHLAQGSGTMPFMPGPPPGFAPNMRLPQGFPTGMPNMFMAGQNGPNGQRPVAPGFPPGMPPGQPGPPPGFGRGPPAHAGPPPGLMGIMPGNPAHGAGRQGFDPMYEQRR